MGGKKQNFSHPPPMRPMLISNMKMKIDIVRYGFLVDFINNNEAVALDGLLLKYEILEKNKGADNLALVGIRTRGVTLAQRIKNKIWLN